MNKKLESSKGLTDKQAGVMLILPGLAIFVTIILYPFINSIIMSFTDRSLLYADYQFIGLENYKIVLSDPYLWQTVKTTGVFVIFATLVPFILGLLWAIILNQGFKGSEFLRGVTLVNWIIPGTAIGFLWMWIFNAEYGVLNGLLQNLGLIELGINWMGQKKTALAVVIIARSWQMLPWYMAFLLGGLQGVDHEQIEAARIDGANNWQVFRNVVIPSIKGIASIVLALGAIGNLQHFDLPWVMTEGGPARGTTTFAIDVYRTAFKNWDIGKAATIGTIWAVLLAIFSAVYLNMINKDET